MRTVLNNKKYVLVALWADGTETVLTKPVNDFTKLQDAAVKLNNNGCFGLDDYTEIREVK